MEQRKRDLYSVACIFLIGEGGGAYVRGWRLERHPRTYGALVAAIPAGYAATAAAICRGNVTKVSSPRHIRRASQGMAAQRETL